MMDSCARAFAVLAMILAMSGCGSSASAPKSDSRDVPADADASDGAEAADTGDGTTAQGRVKQFVNAIESCSTLNADGSYSGCADIDAAVKFEPSLAAIRDRTVITAEPDGMGYAVAVTTPGGATYTETHRSDGTLEKTCKPEGVDGCGSGGRWG